MADQGTAVGNIADNISEEFDSLVSLMNDIGDNQVIDSNHTLGGITVKAGREVNNPATMLLVSNATANQSTLVGQEIDAASKASQLLKMASQK